MGELTFCQTMGVPVRSTSDIYSLGGLQGAGVVGSSLKNKLNNRVENYQLLERLSLYQDCGGRAG